MVRRRGFLVGRRLPRERMDERRMGHRLGVLNARAKVRVGNARRRALAGRSFASCAGCPLAGCTGPLVFLRVGQARVHGKRKRRVMSRCIERVAFPAAPRSLKRKKQPRARRRPRVLGENLPARREQLAILLQRIARKEKPLSWKTRNNEFAGTRKLLRAGGVLRAQFRSAARTV